MPSAVLRPLPAMSHDALSYFETLMSFETDCWDVNHAISNQRQDFILLDVRSEDAYAQGHLPESLNLPHHKLSEETLAQFARDTMFVVYCAGPHCNGADRAGIRLAKLNRPVKKMIGGIAGWLDEGFDLVQAKG